MHEKARFPMQATLELHLHFNWLTRQALEAHRMQMPTPASQIADRARMINQVAKGKAVGYVRVSTQGQADYAGSLDRQAMRIREYAGQNGLTLIGIFEDVGSAMPKNRGARPEFEQAVQTASRENAVLVVTDVDRLTRSREEMKDRIVTPRIAVHVVSLNRSVGRKALLDLAKKAEAAGAQIGMDTKRSLKTRRDKSTVSSGRRSSLKQAANASQSKRKLNAMKSVTDLGIFIAADPLRNVMTRKELVDVLNAAQIRTSTGKKWTVDALSRPLRKAKAHLRLQDELEKDFVGFDKLISD